MLSREQILAADDLKREAIDVPEWGGQVFLSVMTAGARDAFAAEGKEEGITETIRQRLIARTAVDEDGKLLFSDEDITALSAKNTNVIDRLFMEALRINGMRAEDAADAEKN